MIYGFLTKVTENITEIKMNRGEGEMSFVFEWRHSVVFINLSARVILSRFNCSLYQPWASYFISLHLSLFICKIGLTEVYS